MDLALTKGITMKLTSLVFLCLCLYLSARSLHGQEVESVDLRDRAIALADPSIAAGLPQRSQYIFTGFCIKGKQGIYLVTSAAIAKTFSKNARVGISAENGEGRWCLLLNLVKHKDHAPWEFQVGVDTAIARLDKTTDPDFYGELANLAIPLEDISDNLATVGSQAVAAGYPTVLHPKNETTLTALQMNTSIAHQEFVGPGNLSQLSSILVVPSLPHGCVGGPLYIFDAESGRPKCIGHYFGVMPDLVGAHMGMITPIRYAKQRIEEIESNAQ